MAMAFLLVDLAGNILNPLLVWFFMLNILQIQDSSRYFKIYPRYLKIFQDIFHHLWPLFSFQKKAALSHRWNRQVELTGTAVYQLHQWASTAAARSVDSSIARRWSMCFFLFFFLWIHIMCFEWTYCWLMTYIYILIYIYIYMMTFMMMFDHVCWGDNLWHPMTKTRETGAAKYMVWQWM